MNLIGVIWTRPSVERTSQVSLHATEQHVTVDKSMPLHRPSCSRCNFGINWCAVIDLQCLACRQSKRLTSELWFLNVHFLFFLTPFRTEQLTFSSRSTFISHRNSSRGFIISHMLMSFNWYCLLNFFTV